MTHWHPGNPGRLMLEEHIERNSPRRKPVWELPLWKLSLWFVLSLACWGVVIGLLYLGAIAFGWLS